MFKRYIFKLEDSGREGSAKSFGEAAMSDQELKFNVLCSLFNWMQRSKSAAKKRSKFRIFLDSYCKPKDYFSAIRLILPSLDRERGTYGLKESVLATCLIDALGISRESDDARRLVNWRKGGAKTGANVGNFPLVAAEVLQHRQGMTSGGLTINDLNDVLDRLASSENRAEKTTVLSDLIRRTNAQEMKWIVMIILKDLKLGVSEKSIFHEFHPDAEDLFNVTCDLKLVCEKLRDRNQRHKRQDIEIGKAVRPQLAQRVSDATSAWKKLHGKQVVVECKFDGDRIQIHKNGTEIHFFSRNFLDHFEYGYGMSDIILQNVKVDRCILDGEMLVWDTSNNRFAEFGSNQEIAKAAKEGLDSDRQLCCILAALPEFKSVFPGTVVCLTDVAFDILYVGDTSVIHQSLKERHDLLRKVVKPLKRRLEILVPNGGFNAQHSSGEPCWSFVAYNLEDVQRFFKVCVENRDEGIVLKDLGSKWDPSDRSGKWLKLKPEYINAGSDLDVLIIGGYYGSGRRGGEVAQFLVGLAERSAPNTYPRRFISFCRVGTGLSDDELDAVVSKLNPYFRKNEYPKKGPPSFYEVTNNSKERPDVWIDSPERSIILSITSDIRTIRSEVFAAPYGLRFPRIDQVRYDKPWHECLDVQSFIDLVHSNNGSTQREREHGGLQDNGPKRKKSSKRSQKQNVSVVPSHFIQTDVSGIQETTFIFSNMMFYFVNVPPTHTLDSFHKMVTENGGTFSMNLNDSVTHCIAADRKGIKYKAAKLHRDIIHYSWVLDCCSRKRLLHLQPKYFLFLSESTKNKFQEEMDEFSDTYYWDLDIKDLKQLFSSMNRPEDRNIIEYYKKKYCPMEKWSRFHGCHLCFYMSTESLNLDWQGLLELAMRRMKLEISICGGEVSKNLSEATHLVVLSAPGSNLNFEAILESFSAADRRLLRSRRLHIVGYQWLEDSFEKDQKLQEERYNLKPNDLEDLKVEQSDSVEAPSDFSELEKQDVPFYCDKDVKNIGAKPTAEIEKILTSAQRDVKPRRGRSTSTNNKRGRTGFSQTRRTRAKLGNKPAKIDENISDNSGSLDETIYKDNKVPRREDHENHETKWRKDQVNEENKGTCGIDISQGNKAVKQETIRDAEIRGLCDDGRGSELETEEMQKNEKTETSQTLYGDEEKKKDDTEKLEVTVDPFQAMLLDMIPSLGLKKEETTDSVPGDQKPSVDPEAEPLKKRKVSYKDVAGELLKDL